MCCPGPRFPARTFFYLKPFLPPSDSCNATNQLIQLDLADEIPVRRPATSSSSARLIISSRFTQGAEAQSPHLMSCGEIAKSGPPISQFAIPAADTSRCLSSPINQSAAGLRRTVALSVFFFLGSISRPNCSVARQGAAIC
jgi:hypothetical protein